MLATTRKLTKYYPITIDIEAVFPREHSERAGGNKCLLLVAFQEMKEGKVGEVKG